MSKLELDDQILNHDKFVLAVKRAGKFGGDVVFMWLGIRAYCGQRLTDGFIPTEMLGEVRGPLDQKQREAAVKALCDIGLLEKVDGGLQMHDYLQWSRSKSQVLADRARARERQAKSRRDIPRDDGGGDGGTNGGSNARSSVRVTKASGSSSASSTTSSPTTTGSGDGDLEDPGRETVCPLNLLEKLENNGTIARLAEQVPAPIDAVRACLRAFVATWTIGKLAGQRRSGWPGRARRWVIDQHAQGKLKASGPASGTSLDPEAAAMLQRLRAIP